MRYILIAWVTTAMFGLGLAGAYACTTGRSGVVFFIGLVTASTVRSGYEIYRLLPVDREQP